MKVNDGSIVCGFLLGFLTTLAYHVLHYGEWLEGGLKGFIVGVIVVVVFIMLFGED